MEKTYKQKLARCWEHNIHPVTGWVNIKRADDDVLRAKKRATYFNTEGFLEERKEDREQRKELGI
tara:strand:+ start:3681 stop:3875 length:195 start_codon:yes stop_codon:yes gene_type:complete